MQTVLRLESGKSLLKLTTASYFRPSGINIHRSEELEPEHEWGVKPNEGHEFQMSKEQLQSWLKARDDIDYERPIDNTDPEDPHLADATAWLTKEIAGTEKAE